MRHLVSVLIVVGACGPSISAPDDQADAGQQGTVDAGPRADADMPSLLMYAHSATTLYALDSEELDLVLIGDFGIANADERMIDLAVTPSGDIFGVTNTKLYSINANTGRATPVADVPWGNVGMTFLPDGNLLATDEAGGVWKINPDTGVTDDVGAFGSGFATAGDLVAVADGTMYAISDEPDAHDDNYLLIVNTSTGVGRSVGQIGFGQVWGAAYANGHVYAFTKAGQLIEINRTTGAGRLVKTFDVEFWGAAVTPLVEIE
jgi:hypothetical protein